MCVSEKCVDVIDETDLVWRVELDATHKWVCLCDRYFVCVCVFDSSTKNV